MRVTSSVRRGMAIAVVLAAIAAGCASKTDEPPTSKPSPSSATGTSEVTIAVYGPAAVIAAYQQIASEYTATHPHTKVVVQSYDSHAQAMAAYQSALAKGDPPDLFLMDHGDLTGLTDAKAIQPVDDLLADREVDFGDGYTRNGLEAFTSDAQLQCMPLDVSPLVVYYNPKLIELDKVAEPGRNPVSQDDGWSLDEFRRAAMQARRPGVRGLYIAPDLEQVAPFIWSGGGEVVDDTDKPTTLTLSDGPSASALEKLLELVRNPGLTFSENALRKHSALERFETGKLGMMLGSRDLVPRLRAQQELTFDVMPLPRISHGATIATMTGLCLSAASKSTKQAADFLTQVISDPGATILARTGYVMPSNLDVVNGEDFLQTGQRPLHSGVFTKEVRDTQLLPSDPQWPTVRRATARDLADLFTEPVIVPLQDRLEAIDAASIPMFDPSKASSSASPSTSP